MIVVTLLHREYDRAAAQFVSVQDARIEVDGDDLRVVEGDPAWAEIRELVVDDPERPGRDLTFDADPERWALAVPAALRADTVATAERAAVEVGAPRSAEAAW